jgi:hypothetical protein
VPLVLMGGVVALGDESSISCGIDPDINGERLLPQAYLHLCCPLATSGWQPKQLWSYDLYLRIGCVFFGRYAKDLFGALVATISVRDSSDHQ